MFLVWFLLVVQFLICLEIGSRIMSTQDAVDALAIRLSKATAEVLGKIAEVQEQLVAAGVPPEAVDLSALSAAVELLDDVVPDVVPVPQEVVAEELTPDVAVEADPV